MPLEPRFLVGGAKEAFPAVQPVGTNAENESREAHEHPEVARPVHESRPQVLVFPDEREIYPVGYCPEPCPESFVGIRELQDIAASGGDVQLISFRSVIKEFVHGQFPFVVGKRYPLVEGVQGVYPSNVVVRSPGFCPPFTEGVIHCRCHGVGVGV